MASSGPGIVSCLQVTFSLRLNWPNECSKAVNPNLREKNPGLRDKTSRRSVCPLVRLNIAGYLERRKKGERLLLEGMRRGHLYKF